MFLQTNHKIRMAYTGKDLRGSGSKENVGRHKNPYDSKKICKNVPADVYDTCLSLIDAEVLKFKIKNNIK